MPHVTIKHFPRDFTEEQKQRMADEVTRTVLANFDTHEGAVSVSLEPVDRSEWDETVVAAEITGREHLLIKAPNYRK